MAPKKQRAPTEPAIMPGRRISAKTKSDPKTVNVTIVTIVEI
jgi:hypothetical protein